MLSWHCWIDLIKASPYGLLVAWPPSLCCPIEPPNITDFCLLSSHGGATTTHWGVVVIDANVSAIYCPEFPRTLGCMLARNVFYLLEYPIVLITRWIRAHPIWCLRLAIVCSTDIRSEQTVIPYMPREIVSILLSTHSAASNITFSSVM